MTHVRPDGSGRRTWYLTRPSGRAVRRSAEIKGLSRERTSRSSAGRSAASTKVSAWSEKPSRKAQRRRDAEVRGALGKRHRQLDGLGLGVGERVGLVVDRIAVATREQVAARAHDARGDLLVLLVGGRRQGMKAKRAKGNK